MSACDHDFEFVRATIGNGVVGRCKRCRVRFTAWPGGIHYDDIKGSITTP